MIKLDIQFRIATIVLLYVTITSCSLFDNSRSFSREDWDLVVADGKFDVPVKDCPLDVEKPYYTLVRSGEYLKYEFSMDATWSVKKITLIVRAGGDLAPITEEKTYLFERNSEVVVKDSILIPSDIEYLSEELPQAMNYAIKRSYSLYGLSTRRHDSHSLWIVE